jgi:phosphoribosylglycinamide formyltransferase-1
MLNIVVLASGNGSNLQAIIDAIESGKLDARIQCVISDRKSAFALERAKNHHIPAYHISAKSFNTREEHEKEIVNIIHSMPVDLVVLAGYMRVFTSYFIREFKNKIINIHPALLPSFAGAHGIKEAFDYGVKITGVTIHFVDEGIDTGPIIAQVPVEIQDNDTLESLEEKIHRQEHLLYPQVLQWFSEKRVQINGRKVTIQ